MAHNLAQALLSEDRLARYADHAAIVCDNRVISYSELAVMSRVAGDTLLRHAGRPGVRVIVRGRDTEVLVAVILGAMMAGLVPVILSPRTTEDDLRYVADETAAALLVEDDDLGISPIPLPRLSMAGLAADRATASEDIGASSDPDSKEAFWLYSSGTTGRMKGVIHAHHDLAPVLVFHENCLNLGPEVRTFCTSRISFAYAMSNALLAPLALGATVVLHPEWPTAGSTLAAIEAVRPQVVFAVPSMYRAWLDLPAEALAPMALVRRFVSAGEHLPVPVAERWRAITRQAILDCHGTSETCFLVFASSPDRPKAGSVGFPCPGVETELRDEADGPAPAGAAGRLFIRHPFLALGYGPFAPAEVQARFQNGWFATGDVFRCDDDGHWHHYGREDDWLKIAGQWVSLHGVEEAAAACAGVEQAVGVTANDANGFLRVALFVVPAADADDRALPERLETFLNERLPAFKRPKWLRVVDDLPRTSTGKVKKADLRRMIEVEVA
ncbi:MAG: AMP-binding protein [Rhodospirillales bacterium]|nr:AMP-binding protein [Rhodospirillales bacterium]